MTVLTEQFRKSFSQPFRNKWQKVNLAYEKAGQMEVSGEETCYHLMKSVVQELKNESIAYNPLDLDIHPNNDTNKMLRDNFNKHSGKYFSQCFQEIIRTYIFHF